MDYSPDQVNLLVNVPNLTDATSMYRGMGPITEMGRLLGRKLNIIMSNDWNWVPIDRADIVFMQRPYNNSHLSIAQMVKAQYKPLWVDYDDDLFNVPTDNPAYHLYCDDAVKKNIAKIIALADVVTVTTPHLKKIFEQGPKPLNKNIRVIPNGFNFKMFGEKRDEVLHKRMKVVMWRGSVTHVRDVMSYSKEVLEVSKEERFTEWIWRFIGDNLWFLTDYMNPNKVVWSKGIDPVEYFHHAYDIAPAVIIVPLHESIFNRSKSNIAWIEGTFAGAVTIAPDWEEWRRPGVVNYKNPEDFKKALQDVMSHYEDYQGQVRESWHYIKNELSLKKLAEQRVQILRDLNVLR